MDWYRGFTAIIILTLLGATNVNHHQKKNQNKTLNRCNTYTLLLVFITHESTIKALCCTEVAQNPIHYQNPHVENVKKMVGNFQVIENMISQFLPQYFQYTLHSSK